MILISSKRRQAAPTWIGAVATPVDAAVAAAAAAKGGDRPGQGRHGRANSEVFLRHLLLTAFCIPVLRITFYGTRSTRK